jgi:hypothetical protein
MKLLKRKRGGIFPSRARRGIAVRNATKVPLLLFLLLTASVLFAGSLTPEQQIRAEAFTAGEVYWLIKQKYPAVSEEDVKAVLVVRLQKEWGDFAGGGATVGEVVRDYFERGAKSAGEPKTLSEAERMQREVPLKALHP